MSLLAALLLAAAPTAPITDRPAMPRGGASVSAGARVEILRAERIAERPNLEGVERRNRQTPQGLLIEFI
jgi:hypothetical protein